MSSSPTEPLDIRRQWEELRGDAEGRRRFSEAIGQMAPYTGTIGAEVVELDEGYCKTRMEDRHEVRNHLDSVHAVALLNLAEVTSGLAMLYAAPDDAKTIITGIDVEYLKKARGTLTSECRCEVPRSNERRQLLLDVSVQDTDADVVARARVTWLIAPR